MHGFTLSDMWHNYANRQCVLLQVLLQEKAKCIFLIVEPIFLCFMPYLQLLFLFQVFMNFNSSLSIFGRDIRVHYDSGPSYEQQ